MRTIVAIALVLLIVRGLNWIAIGITQVAVVAAVFGGQLAQLARDMHTLVGLSAILVVVTISRVWGSAIFSDLPRRR